MPHVIAAFVSTRDVILSHPFSKTVETIADDVLKPVQIRIDADIISDSFKNITEYLSPPDSMLLNGCGFFFQIEIYGIG